MNTCAHPRCLRPTPCMSGRSRWRDQFCTLHDGLDYGLGVCICFIARADGIGQCIRCWHPIVSLHVGLAPLADRYPQLLLQRVEAAA